MKTKRAGSYGFCFGVKRAIELAEQNKNATTIGPLIHNQKEIERLKRDFGVEVQTEISAIKPHTSAIIRTHGIPKNDLAALKNAAVNIIDATCPFVTKPQKICEAMSAEGYEVVIFGDSDHPEVKGVKSYCEGRIQVVLKKEQLQKTSRKVALISQTTKSIGDFLEIADFLVQNCQEVRVFNTICNATFDNQEAIAALASEADIVIVVGGKSSSNTKQLLNIALKHCQDSYCVEDENELDPAWFGGKKLCGISAGASTPDWIIERVEARIQGF